MDIKLIYYTDGYLMYGIYKYDQTQNVTTPKGQKEWDMSMQT